MLFVHYNNLNANTVTDYGARVAEIYDKRPWVKPGDKIGAHDDLNDPVVGEPSGKGPGGVPR